MPNRLRAGFVLFMCLPAGLMVGCASSVPGEPVPAGDVTITASREEDLIFDETALAMGVRDVLTRQYHVTGVGEVRCPPDQAVKAGNQFDCSVVINGEERAVTITVRTDIGEYEVSPPE